MPHATIVRYTTRPERADENEELIRAVFDELAQVQPAGVRYTVTRLEDGVSFVHVAVIEGAGNPLVELPAFRRFVSAIGDRCVEGPTPADGSVVGSYRMGADPVSRTGS